MSTSYPFLAVARQYNEDYGTVLLYLEVLRRRRTGSHRHSNWHEREAVARISTVAAIAVGRALDREEARREKIRREETGK